MDTTWAVISWSVPSYIPQDYPIITYEAGYYVISSGNCSTVDSDIDFQMRQLFNSTNSNTFIIITDLKDASCYIFGVRAYTENGYGKWAFIVNRTLKLPQTSPCFPSNSNASNTVIALCVLVGVLCILLTVSVIIYINYFIRKKSSYATNKQTNDDNIPMQVCEPYEIHKKRLNEENEEVYAECQTSPDDIYEPMPQ
ncbi:PREDICTED: uncharacterized protein LOC109585448 isoform X2 [Amphimedon queenslandica]|uniref:Fibronectin type-III domain-containing protein n=1 Tax=Amphimedon queenslandica TaxID=400682 RepID=A0AAN0JJY4_AMPQE|nr:PREDICTED: uncharacterized protein LOC109585448 isoform X2 [Amphimedon queenslandica]|eukprot:XP_019857096.1 PREDICTED: uncharacterized protein LOC109585448 isoform X2 [Amphimedon queenslandica]